MNLDVGHQLQMDKPLRRCQVIEHLMPIVLLFDVFVYMTPLVFPCYDYCSSFFYFFLDRESVLEHFVHKVQCRGLFSTHYHRLAVDFQKDPKVCFCCLSLAGLF